MLSRGATESPRSARSLAPSLGSSARARLRPVAPLRALTCAAVESQSYFAKVLSDLCILEVSDEELLNGLGALEKRLDEGMFTHVVDFRCHGAVALPLEVATVLKLPWSSPERCALEFLDLLPCVFDFLRHAAVLRGLERVTL